MSDYRQAQELQEQREAEILSALLRVKERCGDEIALSLAANFGLSNEYRQFTERRAA